MGLRPLPRVAAGRDQPVHHRHRVEQAGAGRVPGAVHQLELGQGRLAGQPQAELAGEGLVTGRTGQPDQRVPCAAERGEQALRGRARRR